MSALLSTGHSTIMLSMARWRDVADDLRRRIGAGEFGIGDRLPPIQQLQEHYGVPSLTTIRQAQQLLAAEGLLDRRRGVGVFVAATSAPPAAETLLSRLKDARAALDRAIAELERAGEHR
jgi:DNA-binding GntR family transcriptional regulator